MKAQIYYDPCDNYDGTPGWSLRQPDEVCDLNLQASDPDRPDEAIAELVAAGYFAAEIEIIDCP